MMNMDTHPRNSSEQDLIDRLHRLPLEKAPADLSDRVMARIAAPKPSLAAAIWNLVSRPYSISFRPVYAFGFAVLVCGAFFLGKNTRQVPVQIAQNSLPVAQIQPETIENPESAYLVGRGLLRADSSERQALAFLQRASLLEPQNPEFAYWEGVGHWANGDEDAERSSYLRGLEADPDNVPLLINLGHSYLGEKRYKEALGAYQAVLDLVPGNPVARYNSGLIHRALGMVSEEIASWRSFLQEHREGTKPFRAVQRLNDYGDFSFRIYQIGVRKIIVNQQLLLDESVPEEMKQEELAGIASILEENDQVNLEVVVFIEHDREAARKRAITLKRLLVQNSKTDVADQVSLSWFAAPETIEKGDSTSGVELSEGLLIFSRLITENNKEVSI